MGLTRRRPGRTAKPRTDAASRRALVLATAADAWGDGLFITVTAPYYTRVLQLGAGQIAAVTAVAGVLGLLGGIAAGRLADRVGPTRIYRLVLLAQSACAAVFLLADSVLSLTLCLALVVGAERANRAVRGGLVARLATPGSRVRLRARLRAAANGAVAAGAFCGAFAIHDGTEGAFRAALAVNVLSYLAALALLAPLPPMAALSRPKTTTAAWRDHRYLAVTVLAGIMAMNIQVITVGLPLWVTLRTRAPATAAAGALLLSTLMVVFLQRRLSEGTDTAELAAARSRTAGVLLCLACCIIPLSGVLSPLPAAAVLLMATAVHTIGSIKQAACAFALSFDLSPPHAAAEYQGVFGLAAALATAFGTSATAWPSTVDGPLGWIVLGAMFLAGGALTRPVARWAQKRTIPLTDQHAPATAQQSP
ncbi:MFS transporter [Streptomyces vinaceus]